MPQRRKIAVPRALLALAASLCLAGCYEEEDQTIAQPAAPVERPAATGDAAPWLEVGDPRSPLDFLAEASGSSAPALAPGFEALAVRYRESPRMIANRLLQLSHDHPEIPLPQLMADLLPGAGGPQHSLGPVAQQYRVLREQGRDHAAAVAGALGPVPP